MLFIHAVNNRGAGAPEARAEMFWGRVN